MPVHATYPLLLDRATRRRHLRRRLEPWLLGLCGFLLTAIASLLLKQEGPADQRVAAVAGQMATLASR